MFDDFIFDDDKLKAQSGQSAVLQAISEVCAEIEKDANETKEAAIAGLEKETMAGIRKMNKKTIAISELTSLLPPIEGSLQNMNPFGNEDINQISEEEIIKRCQEIKKGVITLSYSDIKTDLEELKKSEGVQPTSTSDLDIDW